MSAACTAPLSLPSTSPPLPPPPPSLPPTCLPDRRVAVALSSTLLVVVVVVQVCADVCPGGKVKCPENTTCCQLANHEFGCCKYPEAQCCRDHVHCCPHSYKCDERQQSCLKNGFPAVSFAQASVKPELVQEADLLGLVIPQQTHSLETNHIDGHEGEFSSRTCPDGHECPSSFTCCKMFRGNYGCCPYNDAKCCKDGFHCCPHGSQCDPVSGGCENSGNWLGKAVSLMTGQQPSKPEPEPEVELELEPLEVADPGGKCPDGHPCLEKFTCCKVQDGGYGCCPYTEAVCCTDLIHCCPKNTNCNNSLGTCDVERSFSVPSFSLATQKMSTFPAQPAASPTLEIEESDAPNDVCPDHRSRCNPGSTCCLMRDGSYGCCPMPKATCCSNHESCCPNGYRCVAGGMCERVSTVAALPFLPPVFVPESPTTTPSEPSPTIEEENVPCPDRSMCPDGNTCCSISSYRYGCCPMPQATCCGDMKHCCPHGYWCADQGCERLEARTLNKTLITHHSLDVGSPKVMVAP
uniref:Granulins domain-containing protein n=1 Tax=Scylla olivacea TaxID=85551 RepID=A0A0P4VWT1_SCYOL